MYNLRVQLPRAQASIQTRGAKVITAGLKVGEKAPEFSLKDQNGRTVSVKYSNGLFGGKSKVIFFYPKDNTPGCTLEAKAFRDAYAELKKYGADVIGISSDSSESHKSFCDELDLPYTLLADEDGSIREQFGVKKDLLGLLPGRETYVIDPKGTILKVFNNQFSPEKHVEAAIQALTN